MTLEMQENIKEKWQVKTTLYRLLYNYGILLAYTSSTTVYLISLYIFR